MAKRRKPPELIAGPYKPPRVLVDDILFDERHGEAIVRGFTRRLRWPTAKWGRHTMPIVCGELVRVIETESSLAVVYWWETSSTTLHRWKKSLGVGATEGAHRLRVQNTFSDEERSRAVETITGIPHRNAHSAVVRKSWDRRRAEGDPVAWTAGEIALLGTDKDIVIADQIGRSHPAVESKRLALGIPPVCKVAIVCIECGRKFRGDPLGGRGICSAKCKRQRKAGQLRAWQARQG